MEKLGKFSLKILNKFSKLDDAEGDLTEVYDKLRL